MSRKIKSGGPSDYFSHVSVGTSQCEDALAFYDKFMGALGTRRILEEHEVKADTYA